MKKISCIEFVLMAGIKPPWHKNQSERRGSLETDMKDMNRPEQMGHAYQTRAD